MGEKVAKKRKYIGLLDFLRGIMGISKKEKQSIDEFKEKLIKNLSNNFVKLILFGSKARGDSNKYSDIDILLILKNSSEKDKNKVYNIVGEILLKYGVYLSVKIFSQKEYEKLNKIPSVFMQVIKRESIVL